MARHDPILLEQPPALTLLYDARCGVCALEMDELRRRDAGRRLAFVDVAAAEFDAAAWGFEPEALDAEIHGVRADGTVARGLEALREGYAAAGMGWLLQPTAWPLLKPFADAGYRVFARHRRSISRVLAPVIESVAAWRVRRHAARLPACGSGACNPLARAARTNAAAVDAESLQRRSP